MKISDEALQQLTALAGLAMTSEDLHGALSEICRVAVRAIPAADGASVTTFSDSGPAAVAFSDEWSRALDERQYAEHEGPCLDATRVGQLFRVRDLAADTRWPSYGPVAASLGAASMLSVPMAVESKVIGALNIYARATSAFTPDDVGLAEVVTAHASLATQVIGALMQHRELSERLRGAMTSMPVVEQAKGILMAQRRITAAAAFDLLREVSQHSNTKLRLVAQHVVETGELPPS
jgi:GAF domain-containing protein